jgi:hypothetical protein
VGEPLENFEKIESEYRQKLKAHGVGVGISRIGLGIEIFVCFGGTDIRRDSALGSKKSIDLLDASEEMPKLFGGPSIKTEG